MENRIGDRLAHYRLPGHIPVGFDALFGSRPFAVCHHLPGDAVHYVNPALSPQVPLGIEFE
jgi:hypothetical protein